MLDGGGDFGIVGRRIGGEAFEDGAVAADEEFLEVPQEFREFVRRREAIVSGVAGEIFAPRAVENVAWRGGDECGIERVLLRAGDGDLREERESDGILAGAEPGDLLVGTRLLPGEVVGGKAKDDEAAFFVLLVEGFEGGVLRGEAAPGRNVDDEEDFAGVVGEGGLGAVDGGKRDGG